MLLNDGSVKGCNNGDAGADERQIANLAKIVVPVVACALLGAGVVQCPLPSFQSTNH